MQRQMLRLTLALGVLVTMLGSTGVFAVFSDSARGGNNSVESGVRPRAADLQIATGTGDDGLPWSCGTFSENLSTGQFAVTGLQPGEPAGVAGVCLFNAGAGTLSVTVGATGTIRDLDVACTGDEAANGDETCGTDQLGELSPLLYLTLDAFDCATGDPVGGVANIALDSLQAGTVPVGDLPIPANGRLCTDIEVGYSDASTEAEAQIAQSDKVTWTLTFVGTAS